MMFPERLGPYQLLARLGKGGMGEVYLARLMREAGFEKKLALKRILPALSGRDRFRDGFAAEARLTAALSHPHIVQVTDFGRQGNDCYLVMEYVDGADLATLLCIAGERGGPVPLDFALAVALACLRALGYAHAQRPHVIHGDVSPSNVLVGRQGEVKLTDFGLARLAHSTRDVTERVREVRGNPAYLAPEVAQGQPGSPTADQFGLGGVLYEMLTGSAPFDSATDFEACIELARRGRIQPVGERCADIVPALAQAIDRSLQAQPTRRFAELVDMENALVRVASALELDTGPRAVGQFVQATLPTRRCAPSAALPRTLVAKTANNRADPGPRSWRIPWPVLGATLTAVLVLAALSWWLSRSPSQQTAPRAAKTEDTRLPGAVPSVRADDESRPPEQTHGRSPAGERGTDRAHTAATHPPPKPAAGANPKPRDPVAAVEPRHRGSQAQLAQAPAPGVGLHSAKALAWSLDGNAERVGEIHLDPLPAGNHVLHMRDVDGIAAVMRLEVASGGGSLGIAVRSKPFAILSVDGRPKGTTPLGGIRLSAGDHRIALAKATLPPLVLRVHIR